MRLPRTSPQRRLARKTGGLARPYRRQKRSRPRTAQRKWAAPIKSHQQRTEQRSQGRGNIEGPLGIPAVERMAGFTTTI